MRPIQITDVRVVPGDSAFLIDDGTTAVLYDAGFAFTGTAIAENIRKALGERKLEYILLSHSHYDHVLAVPYIKRIYPDAKVVAGRHAGEVFQKPTARAVMRQLNEKAAAKYGAAQWEDLIDELQVDLTVEDGDEITCNDLHFTAISLPGHTRCAMGYYLEENKLLLGAETLGVYFGGQTYLPSFFGGISADAGFVPKSKGVGGGRDFAAPLRPGRADGYGTLSGSFSRGHTADSRKDPGNAAIRKNGRRDPCCLQRGGLSGECITDLSH